MRHSSSEHPSVVLERLRANEPVWEVHPRSKDHPQIDQHPAGPHPDADGMSADGESRASFGQRHEAWSAAVKREEGLLAVWDAQQDANDVRAHIQDGQNLGILPPQEANRA